MTGGRAFRPTLLVALSALALLGPADAALGHAGFADGTPEPGARLGTSPSTVRVDFTEPLNSRLSRVSLASARTGRPVPGRVTITGRQVSFAPRGKLATGAYQVHWRTVSSLDGHALEGSYSFGVRAAAVGGAHQVQLSPLARGGWLRVLLRALFYAGLLYFGGAVLVGALLGRAEDPSGWLAPRQLEPALEARGLQRQQILDGAWRRARRAGRLALLAGALAVIAEAADAAGGLRLADMWNFLTSNASGISRLAGLCALLFAVRLARRQMVRLAALAVIGTFVALALGGHANSAHPRALAIATDATHLIAAAVWLGGIGQVATAWVGVFVGRGGELGVLVMREVLQRFGRLALVAFAVVVGAGVGNALIQLGAVRELWASGYGRVLAVKIGLVATIAGLSYRHALRLRPRLLASNPHPDAALERRHWRLLGAEPLVALGVVAAAGLLVAFPLPPRQLREGKEEPEAGPAAATAGPPVPAPRPQELSVADHLGPTILGAWVRKSADGLTGQVRLYGSDFQPAEEPVRIPAASSVARCGPGCRSFRIAGRPPGLVVRAQAAGRWYTTSLPVTWDGSGGDRARQLIAHGLRTMGALRSVVIRESLSSGPGVLVDTDYRVRAPDRLAYRLNNGAQSVIIGHTQWSRDPGGRWQRDSYGGSGTAPFNSAGYLRWWRVYAHNVRLLSDTPGSAEVAVMRPGSGQSSASLPTWLSLRIDPVSGRLLQLRMITEGHFMTQHYADFNAAPAIAPPRP